MYRVPPVDLISVALTTSPREGKIPVAYGSFHFPLAFNPNTIYCSANAETQVFDER